MRKVASNVDSSRINVHKVFVFKGIQASSVWRWSFLRHLRLVTIQKGYRRTIWINQIICLICRKVYKSFACRELICQDEWINHTGNLRRRTKATQRKRVINREKDSISYTSGSLFGFSSCCIICSDTSWKEVKEDRAGARLPNPLAVARPTVLNPRRLLKSRWLLTLL